MDQNAMFVAELERAAAVLQSKCSLDKDQRQTAEKIFLEFRSMKSPYKLFQTILETSNVDFVIFSAVGCVTSAVTREWVLLDPTEITSLRQCLMSYVFNKPCSSFVVERILLLTAVIIKIESIQNDCSGCEHIVSEILNLLDTSIRYNDEYKQNLCSKFISALLLQFSLSPMSNNIGVSLEQQFVVKSKFENANLKDILKFFLKLINTKLSQNVPLSDKVAASIINVIQEVLSWTYENKGLSRSLLSPYELCNDAEEKVLNMTEQVKEVLNDADFVPFMFSVCDYYHNTEYFDVAYDCLLTMATVNVKGDDISSYLTYYRQYFECFIKLINTKDMDFKNAISISKIVPKLAVTLKKRIFRDFPVVILEQFFMGITTYTCKVIEGNSHEEMTCNDSETKYFHDSLNNCLTGWSLIIDDIEFHNQIVLKKCCTDIFTTYYRHHLSEPEGIRKIVSNVDEIIHDFEETDRLVYNDQLQVISYMAISLLDIDFVVNCLVHIIDNRTNTLHEWVVNCSNTASYNSIDVCTVNSLFDDLSWSLLISEHFIGSSMKEISFAIPSEVIAYSSQRLQAKETDLNVTIGYLKLIFDKPNHFVTETVTDSRCDPIVKLLYSMLRLAILEKLMLDSKVQNYFSPEVGSLLMCNFRKFVYTYINDDANGAVYTACFGCKSDTCEVIVNFLLSKVQSNIINCNEEETLMCATMDLFVAICTSKELSEFVIDNEYYSNLIQMNDKFNILSKVTLQDLFRGLISAVAGAVHNDTHNELILSILDDPFTRLNSILNSNEFRNDYCGSYYRTAITGILDVVIGAIRGLGNQKCAFALFRILNDHLFARMQELMTIYKSRDPIITHNILEVYHHCSIKILTRLPPYDAKIIYQYFYQILLIYFKDINSTKHLTIENLEENNYDTTGLILILNILKNLVIDSFFDIRVDISGDLVTTEVFWTGIMYFIPLMNVNPTILPLNEVSVTFYEVLAYTNDSYFEGIEKLPFETLVKIFRIIELGLNCQSHQIQNSCCNFIRSSALNVNKNANNVNESPPPILSVLRPFMGLYMQLIFDRSITVTILYVLSNCLLALIALIPDEYKKVAESIVSAQNNESHKQRLYLAFDHLTKDLDLSDSHATRTKFLQRFQQFIVDIQAFLFIR